LAGTLVRDGYRRLMVLLRREGIMNGRYAVYRVCRVENLGNKRRKRRKLAAQACTVTVPAQRVNERWSMDFLTDRLENSLAFRF
jgi:putative transposase